LIAPGPFSRVESIRRAAHGAVPIVYGATAMLVGAAMVEAFWSATVAIPPVLKLGVGCSGWLGVAFYFLFAGRKQA
jgi:uncharacterized membrane protein SpoIIM required for sporulation